MTCTYLKLFKYINDVPYKSRRRREVLIISFYYICINYFILHYFGIIIIIIILLLILKDIRDLQLRNYKNENKSVINTAAITTRAPTTISIRYTNSY